VRFEKFPSPEVGIAFDIITPAIKHVKKFCAMPVVI
jgi:hypothetical protein